MQKLLILLLILLATKGIAQKGTIAVTGGVNYGSALNKNIANVFGKNVGLQFGITPKSNLTLNYTNFTNTLTSSFGKEKVTSQFVTLGLQQYLNAKRNWYVSGEAGIGAGAKSGQPFFGAGFGYTVAINKISSIDIGTKVYGSVNNAFNNGWLMLNVTYRLKLGKKK